MQNAIGYNLVLIGESENDPARLEEAVPILREALAVQLQLKADQSAAFTADSLCHALFGVGARRSDRAMLLEARQLCESALVGESAAGNDEAVKETQGNLARIEEALKALP
jgi:hypothetical protein